MYSAFGRTPINKNKRIFIGAAWPYANGSLHLGHISALIGADILARFHRLNGDQVLCVSGSDCYGTPIAVEAAERGIDPSDIAERYHAEFQRTLLESLKFSYDIYTKTTTDHHAKVVQKLFLDLHEKGYLYTKVEKVLYSPFLERFLPDRFIEGTCPKCGFDGARGDQCDECGAILESLELKDPKINPRILKRQRNYTEQDLRLEVRESEHFYLKLSALQETLAKWVHEKSSSWRANARNFAKGFVKQGLHDRAITRDTNWGVPIPLPGYENKRIYVWFEAVAGYLSASQLWAEEHSRSDEWKDFWLNDDAVHYYVHGKDNVPFHTIIWPAILLAEGTLHMPDHIISSEYLNLEGKQFSKSRSWAVWLPDFLKSFDPETLRYYLVTNGPEISDTYFYWAEFAQMVNGELIGTFGNLIHRVLSFSQKHFPDGLRFVHPLDEHSTELLELTKTAFPRVGTLIQEGSFRAAWKEIRTVAEHGNRFTDAKQPWRSIKDEAKRGEVETDLAVLTHVIRSLAILTSPFLPTTSERILGFLRADHKEATKWAFPEPQTIQKIGHVEPLYRKIEESEVKREQELLGQASTVSSQGTGAKNEEVS